MTLRFNLKKIAAYPFRLLNILSVAAACTGAFSALAATAVAEDAAAPIPNPPDISKSLPELPGEDVSAPGHTDLKGKSLSLNYDSMQQKWRASIDEYKSSNPMFMFDYGLRLTDQLAAGGRVTHQREYSEVLVNGVYAPRPSLRFTVSGGQLRPNSDYVSESANNGYNALLQNSYLLDVKKYWSKDSLVSDVGISTYVVEANGKSTGKTASAVSSGMDMGDTESMYLDTPALGKKASLVFNLGLHPTADSRVEWRRERGRLNYYVGDEIRDREYLMSSRFKYSHNIDNCTQLQGRYRSSDNYDRMNLGIERNNWNFSISRTRDDGVADTGFQIGYKIPLSGSLSSVSNCKQKPESAPSFSPILDTSTSRPDLFPRDALVK
ncbi:hypothetical protein [Undibacterium terreum]|uniref:Uncharacterized protein n=1 Tax=Undibacterium terreum TaxID=1224302 RepID=A0A916U5B1_9BURK|nr:hypothetical protein [Undibacterium terreum]GGC60378.1 hypothetical protein GCM10011396_04050 [Undibacterium terreum]